MRDRSFGSIREDDSNSLLARLRERHLSGRCARCQYRDVRRGASRSRALAVHGDPFAPDPQCYYADDEVAPEAPADPAAD